MADFQTNVMQAYDLITKVAQESFIQKVESAAQKLLSTILKGGCIYIAGNGGSASDAMHFSGELLGRFVIERKAIACISLVSDIATITAIANDYGYDAIFERQLEGLFKPDKDIFIGLSTSGESLNIIRALDYLSKIGGASISLLGKHGGRIKSFYNAHNTNIIIPSMDTARIQEVHMMILHYFAEFIEEGVYNK
jgi:D-sedoheptulose 7-phosphate isomerase